jgi:hypothetical protein
VRNATHLDAESPTDFLGQLACGWSAPWRHAYFQSYAIAFLKANLMDDAPAKRVISSVKSDPAVLEAQIPDAWMQ